MAVPWTDIRVSRRLAIQHYGIYNPYTGRGAIKGLLPHGPHNARDVLATHVLKQTGCRWSTMQSTKKLCDRPCYSCKAMQMKVYGGVWSVCGDKEIAEPMPFALNGSSDDVDLGRGVRCLRSASMT